MKPKFRAWHKKEKKMLVVTTILYESRTGYQTLWGIKGYHNEIEWVCKVPEICELMQSTGLNDKNGKEIFEGDIISYDNGECVLLTEWDDSNACFIFEPIKQKDWNCVHDIRNYRSGEEWEVIGNKFENPEQLLEGKNAPDENLEISKEFSKARHKALKGT